MHHPEWTEMWSLMNAFFVSCFQGSMGQPEGEVHWACVSLNSLIKTDTMTSTTIDVPHLTHAIDISNCGKYLVPD